MKNTFWGKSSCPSPHKLGYSVICDRNFSNRTKFLPSIPCPTAEFSIVCETRQINTSFLNSKHEAYYRVTWINPDEFRDVIIQLGDFMLSCIFLVTVKNLLLTVSLKRLYIKQECVQWVEQNQSYQGSLKTCAGEFT